MEKYQICNIHQEKVDFICREANSNELKGICLSCLPLPQGVPYQSKKNVLINIENNKVLMINHFEECKEYNVKTIKQLIEYLNNYKISQAKKIDQLIEYGEQEINQIKKKCVHSQNQIKEYNASLDIEQLIILYNTLINETSLDTTQKLLLEMLLQAQQESFLFGSYKILQQLPYTQCLDVSDIDNINALKKVYKCPKHNQAIVGVDLNLSEKNIIEVICLDCINNKNATFTKLDQAKKIWIEYHQRSADCQERFKGLVQKLASQAMNQIEVKYNVAKKKLETYLDILENYKNTKLQRLNQIIQQQRISQLDYFSVDHFKLLQKISKLSIDAWNNLEWEVSKFNYFLDQKQNQISKSLRRLNEFAQLISNIQIDQIKPSKIQYEQLSKIKLEEICCAIALNTEATILVAGCKEKINVFEFNSGFLKKIQQLEGHFNDVNCLQFMKNQNVFVSASDDQILIIWKQQQKNNWIAVQTLEGHTDRVFCLVMNQNGDQIISGGFDNSIRFWNQDNQIWNMSQTILDHQKAIHCLSLNESEKQLISCGWDEQILVIEEVQKNQWCVVQKIQTANGFRLCFITNDMFSFQMNEIQLQIYKFNIQQKQFTLIKSIEVKENKNITSSHFLFPQKFIKSKQVLINKHKNYLNIIRRVSNEEFVVDQCIQFKYEFHYGTISDDGEYLITSDEGSNEIKVMQCKEVISSK